MATFAILFGLIASITAWPVTIAVVVLLSASRFRDPEPVVYRTHRPTLRWWVVIALSGPAAVLFKGAFGAENHTPLVGQVLLVSVGIGLGVLMVRALRSGLFVTPDRLILRNVLHTTVVDRGQILALERPAAHWTSTRSGLIVRTAVGGPHRASRFAFPASSPLPPVAQLGAVPERLTVPHTFA